MADLFKEKMERALNHLKNDPDFKKTGSVSVNTYIKIGKEFTNEPHNISIGMHFVQGFGHVIKKDFRPISYRQDPDGYISRTTTRKKMIEPVRNMHVGMFLKEINKNKN